MFFPRFRYQPVAVLAYDSPYYLADATRNLHQIQVRSIRGLLVFRNNIGTSIVRIGIVLYNRR